MSSPREAGTPAPDPGPRGPVPTPLLHALILDRAVSALLSEAMRDSPLTAHDYGIASAIEQQPGISATQLAEQFSVPLTTLAEWLGRLSTLGVVERERDPRDGRRHQLRITAEGESVMRVARTAFEYGYQAFVARLPVPPEVASEQLAAMTRACQEGLEELRAGGPQA